MSNSLIPPPPTGQLLTLHSQLKAVAADVKTVYFTCEDTLEMSRLRRTHDLLKRALAILEGSITYTQEEL